MTHKHALIKLFRMKSITHQNKDFKSSNLISFLKKNNLKILDISIDDGDLEDVFLQLIKN